LLDKPLGLSSNAAVQRVRRAFGRVKAGHTGSLDPLATGMLPVCLGEATKVAGYLLEGDKCYSFTACFGARTATGDLEGEVVERAGIPADLSQAIERVLPRFRGELEQVPPMYSAIKQGGQPLYRLARQGIEVQRPVRRVCIRSLQLGEVRAAEADFTVVCSKGTYVRTLAEDIAVALGSLAHLGRLRRLWSEPFKEKPLVELARLEADPWDCELVAPDEALPHLAPLVLDEVASFALRQGRQVAGKDGLDPGQRLRLYGPAGFLGIGEVHGSGRVQPVRLFNP